MVATSLSPSPVFSTLSKTEIITEINLNLLSANPLNSVPLKILLFGKEFSKITFTEIYDELGLIHHRDALVSILLFLSKSNIYIKLINCKKLCTYTVESR